MRCFGDRKICEMGLFAAILCLISGEHQKFGGEHFTGADISV